MKGYVDKMAEGKFDEAYKEYWTSAAQKVDLGDTKVNILTFVPTTYDINVWFSKYPLVVIDCNVTYLWHRQSSANLTDTYVNNMESLYVINENGNWKIQKATLFPLGTIAGDKDQLKGWLNATDYSYAPN